MRKPLAPIALPILFAFAGWAPLDAQAPDGAVAGRVLDAEGNPADSVRVAIVELDAEGRVLFLGRRSVREGRTDTDGTFRIGNIPAGRYGIVADTGAAQTYFPGTYDATMRADVITVDPGKVTSGIDFSLSTNPPTIWTGIRRPLDETRPGPPLAGVPGRIVIEGATDRPIDAHGEGRFELFFSDGSHNRTGSVTFPLGSTEDASTSLGVRNMFWYVTSVIPMSWGPDGTFRLSLPEGDYRVAPAGTPAIPGFYIRALSYGDVDLSRERMELRSDSADQLVISLAACPDGPESACDD